MSNLQGPGWGYWVSREGISMEPNTDVNGGFSHGYGDEVYRIRVGVRIEVRVKVGVRVTIRVRIKG